MMNDQKWLKWLVAAFGGMSFIATSPLYAEIRVRAREHYEQIQVESDRRANYIGFTNTINVWYEQPFHYSIGFAGSPIFARLRTTEAPSGLSREIRLVHLGIEGKAFPAPDTAHVFVRLGGYQAQMVTGGDLGRIKGTSALGGLGYEFNWGGIGIAPEMSWRRGNLANDVSFAGTAPAIGVHFYKML